MSCVGMAWKNHPLRIWGVKFSYATAVPAHLDVTFFTGSF